MSSNTIQRAIGAVAGIGRARFAGAIVLACAAVVGGCSATIVPAEPVYGAPSAYGPTVEATVVPPDIYVYPHTWYGGRNVYLYGGRWYYPYGRGWRVYRTEPAELGRYRTHIERSPGYYRRAPPPAYQYERRYRPY